MGYVRSWDTIEHDPAWYKEMLNFTEPLRNVRVFTAKHTWDGEGDGTYNQFREYVELPKSLAVQHKYDLVIVDGRARVSCARSAIRNGLLAPNAMLLMHDWERPDNKKLLEKFSANSIWWKFYLVEEDTSGE